MTSPAAIFRGPTRKQEKAQQKAQHVAHTQYIRDLAFARAGGRCERCHKIRPEHLHHMKGGGGRRRQKQSELNVVALCPACHEHVHRHPTDSLILVPCLTCGEPWCPRHEEHYADCPCPGTNGEEPPTQAQRRGGGEGARRHPEPRGRARGRRP